MKQEFIEQQLMLEKIKVPRSRKKRLNPITQTEIQTKPTTARINKSFKNKTAHV